MVNESIEQDPVFFLDPEESYEQNFKRYHRYIMAERETYIKYFGSKEDPMHCPIKARAKFDKDWWICRKI